MQGTSRGDGDSRDGRDILEEVVVKLPRSCGLMVRTLLYSDPDGMCQAWWINLRHDTLMLSTKSSL